MDAQRSFLAHFLEHQAALLGFLIARGLPPDAAEDALQDVAAVLWEKFPSYQEGSNFRAWAFQVTRYVLLQHHASRVRQRRALPLSEQSELAIDTALAEQEVPALGQLQRCLAQLAAHARELVDLRYGQGLTVEDIAQRLAVNAGAIRVRLHRIRNALHRCLERQT